MDNLSLDDVYVKDNEDILEESKEYKDKDVDIGEDIEIDDIEINDGVDIEEDIDNDSIDEGSSVVVSKNSDFISDTGDIVVMDRESEDSFEFKYIDIGKIAIVRRIRKNTNVEALVRSIKSTGLISPVVVAPTATEGLYVLLSGYRRLLACAKAGVRNIPCIVNKKVSTPEIPIIEAMYNHTKKYTMEEIVDYIEYLEKEKGIMSASMIEYLLQLNNGDYTKLKDILNDNDEDIIDKLYSGIYTIEQAFKKLEQRRKKESAEEKELKKVNKVYNNEQESGVDKLVGIGEEANEELELSDEEIKELSISPNNLDDGLEEESLDNMVEEGKKIKGYQSYKQDVNNREVIDPTLRKAVFARDNYTCRCCNRGGGSYIDVMEAHHIIPVFLNKGLNADVAGDVMDNLITVCILCHRMIHLYSTGELHLPKEKTPEELEKMTEEERVIYKDEQMKFKRIVRLGTIIRRGIEKKGIKLEQYRKEYPSRNVGRHYPNFRNNINPEIAEREYNKGKGSRD